MNHTYYTYEFFESLRRDLAELESGLQKALQEAIFKDKSPTAADYTRWNNQYFRLQSHLIDLSIDAKYNGLEKGAA